MCQFFCGRSYEEIQCSVPVIPVHLRLAARTVTWREDDLSSNLFRGAPEPCHSLFLLPRPSQGRYEATALADPLPGQWTR